MRIRKNAKLSSILPSHASTPETLQTHVCQLNQSPWDVIPFSQDSCPSLIYQFEGEDSFTGNGSFGESIGAVESVASLMDGEEKAVMFKVDEMVVDDNENVFDSNEEIKVDDESLPSALPLPLSSSQQQTPRDPSPRRSYKPRWSIETNSHQHNIPFLVSLNTTSAKPNKALRKVQVNTQSRAAVCPL